MGLWGLGAALPAAERPSSQFRGLCYDKKHRAWRVRIFYAGKQRHVGRFKDDVEAARAYDRAAYYLYGDKANLNFTLEEVLNDPLEVSSFIVLAKETAAAADSRRLPPSSLGGTPHHWMQQQQQQTAAAAAAAGRHTGSMLVAPAPVTAMSLPSLLTHSSSVPAASSGMAVMPGGLVMVSSGMLPVAAPSMQGHQLHMHQQLLPIAPAYVQQQAVQLSSSMYAVPPQHAPPAAGWGLQQHAHPGMHQHQHQRYVLAPQQHQQQHMQQQQQNWPQQGFAGAELSACTLAAPAASYVLQGGSNYGPAVLDASYQLVTSGSGTPVQLYLGPGGVSSHQLVTAVQPGLTGSGNPAPLQLVAWSSQQQQQQAAVLLSLPGQQPPQPPM